MSEDVGVDKESLLRLKKLMAAKYPQLIKNFLIGTESSIDQIGSALQAGKREEAQSVAHKMKSSCGQFGLFFLQNIASQIERCEEGSDTMVALHAKLKPAFVRAASFLSENGLDA